MMNAVILSDMKKKLFFGSVLFVTVLGWWIVESWNRVETPVMVSEKPSAESTAQEFAQDTDQPQIYSSALMSPLARASERVMKKPFGIWIDPETSPIQPERFRGYHAGVDFETFSEEAAADVPITAICDGEVITKRLVSGYGGLLQTRCVLDGQEVTVVYGHLRLASIEAVVGDTVTVGANIGMLGTGFSMETDGERKHLHLGIYKGNDRDIRGYVTSKRELGEWLDPCQFFRCSL